MGYDPITGEILTEEERTALAISGSVTAALFIFTLGSSAGAGEAIVTYMSMTGGGSASILTAKACEEMGASELETILFSSLAGILVGYSIAKAGGSCLELYRQHRQTISQEMANDASNGFQGFGTEMDSEEAARYGQWWDDTNSGLNNHHPGMSDEDLNLWRIADERLSDEMALAQVDSDAVIDLRQRWQLQSVYNPVGNGGFEGVSEAKHYLHRPYIRKGTIDGVNANTRVNYKTGQIYDSISGKWVDPTNVELGHQQGYEFWRMRDWAESQEMSQAEFNDYMNNSDFYAWQDITSNRSHAYEQH